MRRIIDVHVHLYPPARLGGLMRWVHRGMPEHPVSVDITVLQAVADLRAAGVERFFSAVFPLAPVYALVEEAGLFLLAHAFFPDLPYAFSLLPRFDNVILDLTNVPGMFLWKEDPLPFGISRPAWGKEEFVAAIEENSGRLLFGSDHPAWMGMIEEIVAQVETFGLSEDAVGKILYGNARGLLHRLELE